MALNPSNSSSLEQLTLKGLNGRKERTYKFCWRKDKQETERTQLLCFFAEWSPLVAPATCACLQVPPESLLTLSDDLWWSWWRWSCPDSVLLELAEPTGDWPQPLPAIMFVWFCWRSELIVARSSFSSASCSTACCLVRRDGLQL